MCKKKKAYSVSIEYAWYLSKIWLRAALVWRILEHFFVLGSFATSVAVIYIAAEDSNAKLFIIILSSLSAVFTLTSFACNPTQYMRCYRKAYDVLNDALVINTDENRKQINGSEGRKQITEAIKKGEEFIGKTYGVGDERDDEENESIHKQ